MLVYGRPKVPGILPKSTGDITPKFCLFISILYTTIFAFFTQKNLLFYTKFRNLEDFLEKHLCKRSKKLV